MSQPSSRIGSGASRLARLAFQFLVLIMPSGTCRAIADDAPDAAQPGPRPATGMLPGRVEVGGYYSWADHGYGDWRGLNAEVWLNRTSRFIPAFMVDSQTRPAGTQQNYAFMSYMNWTPSFYTVQSISGAPQNSDSAIYFPKIRYDIKFNYKLLPDRTLILGAGFTHFDFGVPGKGEIYNISTLYYRGRLVIEGDLFINQSRPGNLTSAAGSMSVQYGSEGGYWLGLTISGGRELYRVELVTPVDVRMTSFTADMFYRRWITRHWGYRLGVTLQDNLDAYRLGGVSARVFFEY